MIDRAWSNLPPQVQDELIEYLEGFVSENRRRVLGQVLQQRTRHVTVVLENIYQAHNASAIMRSCECFGVQDLHVIEKNYAFDPSAEVVMGAAKWLTVYKYRQQNTSLDVSLAQIKSRGYRLVATSLKPGAIPIQQLTVDQPVALCFGTEEVGLSDEVFQHVDECVQIPMFGFTQSFNVSVSVALCLQEIVGRLHQSTGNWYLSDDEKRALLLEWMIRSVRSGEQLVEKYLNAKQEACECRIMNKEQGISK